MTLIKFRIFGGKMLLTFFLLGGFFLGAGCNGISDIFQSDHSTLFLDYTAIKNKTPDTVFVFSPVDSIRWIDSIRYVIKDSVVISYDERTFPEDTIDRYLNLFFRTDNVNDTAGLHFNFLVFDGNKLTYQRDTLYNVPDSVVGWRMEWWR